MIKVVHLITGLGQGGAEKQLSQLVLHSDPTRFNHIVISMQDLDHYGPILLQKGIKVYTLNMRRSSISILGIYRLYKILRQEKPDILQTWLYHADLLGSLVGKYLRFPKIIWNIRCSNLKLNHYSHLTKWVIKFCALISTIPQAVIVNSEAGQKAHATLGYKVKCWINIPNGFKTNDFKPDKIIRERMRAELKIQKDTLLIGMIARFDPMKDHFGFLAAIKNVLQKFNQIRQVKVILVGSGVDHQNANLMREIDKLELQSHIQLLGPRDNVAELLKALDLLVLPSAFGEGFPNVLGEAMSTNVPCVATAVGDSAIIIGATGAIAKPSDPEHLAKSMLEILQLDEVERQRLGELARQRIIENYHFPKIIERYETTYEGLCAE